MCVVRMCATEIVEFVWSVCMSECVCVCRCECVCLGVCVYVCVCVGVCVSGCGGVCFWVCVCVLNIYRSASRCEDLVYIWQVFFWP